jgi:hypothetical protein
MAAWGRFDSVDRRALTAICAFETFEHVSNRREADTTFAAVRLGSTVNRRLKVALWTWQLEGKPQSP